MSIRDVLAESGVLAHVVLPSEIDLLLSIIEPVVPVPPPDANGIVLGDVQLDSELSKSPIRGFDLR
jgi:hypothetical protein